MTQPITHKNQLVDFLAAGCKPPSDWRIGTEHEKFLLSSRDLKRFPYEGDVGIRSVLSACQFCGWEPVLEGGNIIGLKKPQEQISISIEPGGQFELSGAPLSTLHETKAELDKHLAQVKSIVTSMGGVMLSMGTDPLWKREEIPWMPKGRYQLMREYMPHKGQLGLDMMTRTCTVQVNLDFQSEQDMVVKMRIGMALQPIVAALFASSPFLEGKKTGFQSYRSHIWQDTDPDRCGILPFVFEDSMGFERYVDYLLDIPMYFVYRKGTYCDALGQSFRDFMDGKLPSLPGEYPTMKDWMDQTTIAFPEVRLKQFLEMRGADCGPREMIVALPAFWVGLLYDTVAQDEALQLIRPWSLDHMISTYGKIPVEGLNAQLGNQSVLEIAQHALDISYRGLQRRARVQGNDDESVYLEPLIDIAESGRTVSTKLLEMFDHSGNVETVIKSFITSQN
jgi:glutamate--cysteine ligase